MSSRSLALLTVMTSAVSAMPFVNDMKAMTFGRRQTDVPTETCYGVDGYTVTGTVEAGKTPFFAGGFCSNEGGACTLGHSESFSVGYSIGLGANWNLNIDDIFSSANLGATYTETTTKGVTDSVGKACGNGSGQYTCGLMIIPLGVNVTGYQYPIANDCDGNPPDPGHGNNFIVWYPGISGDKNALFNTTVCACPDMPHADDPGAPPKCPINCD